MMKDDSNSWWQSEPALNEEKLADDDGAGYSSAWQW
jgi:hypothetical protein